MIGKTNALSINRLQERSVMPTLEGVSVVPDPGYDGLAQVDVMPVSLEQGTAIPTANEQTLTPSSVESLGFSSVTIAATPLTPERVITPLADIEQAVLPTAGTIGLTKVTVQPIPSEYVVPTGNIELTSADSTDVAAFATATVKRQVKSITPNATEQVITPDSGFAGLSQVTVAAVAPDQYQEKQITPSTETQVITPDSGFSGLSKVTVNAAPLEEEKVITPNTTTQNVLPTDSNIGLTKVVVNPIPSAYIIPMGNKDLTTSGESDVAAFATATVNVEVKAVTPNTAQQQIRPSEGYAGLSLVTVNATPLGPLSKTITTNGTYTYTPESGDIGFDTANIVVNVSGGGGSGGATPLVQSSSTGVTLTEDSFVGLIAIRDYAFYRMDQLEFITFPDTLTAIGAYAFNRSSGNIHTTFTFKSVTPPTIASSSTFSGSYITAIYVPASSVDAYKSATNWSSFASKIFAIVE